MKRIVFVVSRNQPDLVPRLERESRSGTVEVILDRRVADRRRQSEFQHPDDRRRSQRRIHPISPDLGLIGIAVVVVP